MKNDEVCVDKDIDRKLIIETLLSEYNTLKTEIVSTQGEMHQLSLAALASIGGLATLVVTLIKISPNLLASVLIVLPFPFTALMITYIGHINSIINISEYLNNHVEKNINEILNNNASISKPEFKNYLGWEKYLYTKVRGAKGWLAQGLWALGQGMTIGLPIIGSLFAFFFTINYSNLTFIMWWKIFLIIDILFILFIASSALTAIRRYEIL